MVVVAKPAKFKEILGFLSARLLENHYKLYQGYVNKVNEIEEKLKTAARGDANPTFSLIGELKRQLAFATNGVILHELYFENIGSDAGGEKPAGKIAARIKKDFGSFENWAVDFKAAAIAARGWVVLAWRDGRLYNYSMDAHDKGAIWTATPLLVLDVYEHAYFIDYGVARKDYIENFFKNLDWADVEARFKAVEN